MKRLIAPSILVLIVILFHWKLILTGQYTWLASPDMVDQVLPEYQFSAHEVHQGRLPLWDPYNIAGQPLAGQMQASVLYPLHWLFLAAPLDHGWLQEPALHWYYVLIRCWIALAMYTLCRGLNRSGAASVAAGLIYTLGGVEVNADWPQMMHATAWAPLVFLFLLRVLRGENQLRNSVLSGCMLGASWLCGHHAYPVFLTLASAGVWIYAILRNRSLVRYAAVCFTFLFAIGAMQILPAIEYGRLARRWVGAPEALRWNQIVPYNVHSMYSMSAEGMLGMIFPYWSAGYDPYLGIVACGLGLLGAALAWGEQPVRVLSMIGIGGLVYSLAPATPLHGLLYVFVPMVEKTRAPTMATLLVSVAIASLASFGIDSCMGSMVSRWRRRFSWGLGLFGAAILAAGSVLSAQKSPVMEGEPVFLLTAIYALVLAAWIAAVSHRMLSPRWAAALPAILVVMELTKGPSSLWRNRLDHSTPDIMAPLKEDADIAAFLLQHSGAWRVETTDPVHYNFGSWWGIEAITGTAAGVTDNLLWHDIFSKKFAELMSVRFRVAEKPNRDDQILLFPTARGLNVYENARVMPRLWITHQVRRFANRPALRAAFFAETLEFNRTTLVMEPPPALEQCGGAGDEAHFTRRYPSKVEVEATLGCRGILNLNDVYFPGWIATVEGKPVKLYETYGAIRGVVLEQGSHKVVFRYRPASVFGGAAISGLGLIAACIICLRRRTT